MSHAARLLKTLVFAGAALGTNCGGESKREVGTSGGSGAPSAGGSSQGASPAGGNSAVAAAGSGTSAGDPSSICDFTPQRFCLCPEYPCLQSTAIRQGTAATCWCDSNAPPDPSACEHTQQFECLGYDPPESCHCDPTAPVTSADCPNPSTFFSCYGTDPEIGCTCIIKIK